MERPAGSKTFARFCPDWAACSGNHGTASSVVASAAGEQA
jgi:hypothetical protein